jgi:hypothetical protein
MSELLSGHFHFSSMMQFLHMLLAGLLFSLHDGYAFMPLVQNGFVVTL